MAAKKKSKRPSARPRRTAIVPRVVFQTMVAVAVVPTMGGFAAGCGTAPAVSPDAGTFSVAAPLDGGHDAGFFSVVALPHDAGTDAQTFGVADVGFSVAVPPGDGGFSVLVAPYDANTSS